MINNYRKELIVLALQLLMFYIFPLFAGPGDEMGLVVLIIMATFLLSVILGAISEKKIRVIYPAVAGIAFIPSVFIYYNPSALIHALWHFVISAIGICLGALIQYISKRSNKK